MARLRLIHWNAAEAQERASRLEKRGHSVSWTAAASPQLLRELGVAPPDAILIDLSRLPSQGRDVALSILQRSAMRRVPLLFVGGDPEKVRGIRALLPDPVYAEWNGIGKAIARALASPPKEGMGAPSVFAGYSATPLPKKLGIKPGFTVALAGAPADFGDSLSDLPEGTRLRRGPKGACDLILWFVKSARELDHGIEAMAERIREGPSPGDPASLWILWPKKGSHLASDLSEAVVRRSGLDHGLVDYKICAVDLTWSGLRFARRKRASSLKTPAAR